MTQTEAYQVLGLPSSAPRSRVEEAYRKELARVQRQMVPGVPVARRVQAAVRLRELATALETLKASPQPQPRQFSLPPRPRPSRSTNPSLSPFEVFREFWNDFAEIWPFSKTILVLALILSLFACLSFLGLGLRGRANVVATPASSASDARSEASKGRFAVPDEPVPVAGH